MSRNACVRLFLCHIVCWMKIEEVKPGRPRFFSVGELKAKSPGFKPLYMHGGGVPARGACGFSATSNGVLDLF